MDKTFIKETCNILQSIFGLTGKVGVILVPRIRIYGDARSECWGYYFDRRKGRTPWKFNHYIKLATDGVTEKQAFAILAHEYVHAWQTERFWYYDSRKLVTNNDLNHTKEKYFTPWVGYFKNQYDIDIINME